MKTVKRRTVIVNVYPITSSVPGLTPPRPDFPPSPQFNQQEIQDYFDRIFLEQINVKCQIVLAPPRVVAWDMTTPANYDPPLFNDVSPHPMVGDRSLDLNRDYVTPEVAAIIANQNFAGDQLHLFLMGGCNSIREVNFIPTQLKHAITAEGVGFAIVNKERAFVATNGFHPNQVLPPSLLKFPQAVLNTMAHEIGHLIITEGHPDRYVATDANPNVPYAHNGGPAPLARDAALHQRRLMADGLLRKGGIELVLEEWNRLIIRVNEVTNSPAQNGN